MGEPVVSAPKFDQIERASRDEKKYTRDEIGELRALDNITNVRFIIGTWLVIASAMALAIWGYGAWLAGDIAFVWTVPITIAAALVIGASQHQLGGIVHEGTHFLLFKNRALNEIVSDFTAGFALYTSTHSFRLHHFAHHQFVNDPKRDPNFEQAQESGYWLDFPVEHIELVKGFLRLLWPVSLIRYMAARAKQSAIGTETNPFARPDAMGSPWAIRAGVLYAVGVPLVVVPLVALGQFASAFVVLIGGWIALVAYYAMIPDEHYPQSRIAPVVSLRITSIGRFSFLATVYTSITLAELITGAPAWGYFGLLWILPLFTAFPVFMVLREWIQHGNADRGRFTNTRVFLVGPLSRYAVFPLGMDYHLPHHLFVGVPHYKLKRLHELLLRDPEYAEKCRVVDGWTETRDVERPSIVDVLGPRYAAASRDIHIEEETIAGAKVMDRAGIDAQVVASRAG